MNIEYHFYIFLYKKNNKVNTALVVFMFWFFYHYIWVQCMEIELDCHLKELAASSSCVTTLLICIYFGQFSPSECWRESMKFCLALIMEEENKKCSRRILFPPPLQTMLTKEKQEGMGETKEWRNRSEWMVHTQSVSGKSMIESLYTYGTSRRVRINGKSFSPLQRYTF